MFGKLMKYELKATYKWYLIISGVLAILAIFAGLLASSKLYSRYNLYDCWNCCSGYFCGLHWLDLDQLYHYYSSFLQ